MNFCKDCVFCRPAALSPPSDYELAICGRLSVASIDLVSGKERRIDRFCHTERGSLAGECGPSGKLFRLIGEPLTEQEPETDMSARMLADVP